LPAPPHHGLVTNGIGIRRVGAEEGVAVSLIPRHALWPEVGFVHTTLYYKDLANGR